MSDDASVPPTESGGLMGNANSPSSGASINQDVSSPHTPASLGDIKPESYTDMDKSTMIAVIQFLKRGNLKVSLLAI